MEQEAHSWLSESYFQGGSRVLFLLRRVLSLFPYFFGEARAAWVGAPIFVVGTIAALRRGSLRTLCVLLLGPLTLMMVASVLDLFPLGGTRHSAVLLPSLALGVALGVNELVVRLPRARTASLAASAMLLGLFNWTARPAFGQAYRWTQDSSLLAEALEKLEKDTPRGTTVFADYQTGVELAYYLFRREPFPLPSAEPAWFERRLAGHRFVFSGVWQPPLRVYVAMAQAAGASAAIQVGWPPYYDDALKEAFPTVVAASEEFGPYASIIRLRPGAPGDSRSTPAAASSPALDAP
jgi:hypothetical protein